MQKGCNLEQVSVPKGTYPLDVDPVLVYHVQMKREGVLREPVEHVLHGLARPAEKGDGGDGDGELNRRHLQFWGGRTGRRTRPRAQFAYRACIRTLSPLTYAHTLNVVEFGAHEKQSFPYVFQLLESQLRSSVYLAHAAYNVAYISRREH